MTGLAAHKSTDVASCLEVLPMDGELGAPCLGTPLGTQAQQDGILGDRAGWGRHGSLASMPAWPEASSPQLQSPRSLGYKVLARFSALSPGLQLTTPTFWKSYAQLL